MLRSGAASIPDSLHAAIMHTDHGVQYTSKAFADARVLQPGSGNR